MNHSQFYKICPLPKIFLDRVHHFGVDDQNQEVEYHVAKGGEPCRDVLRAAKPGERLILASYCPFTVTGPYKEYGPVYLLADEDATSKWPASLPVMDEREYFGTQFVLRAYSESERIVDAILSTSNTFDTDLKRLLGDQKVAFVLARFAAYGCYGCRIERQAVEESKI